MVGSFGDGFAHDGVGRVFAAFVHFHLPELKRLFAQDDVEFGKARTDADLPGFRGVAQELKNEVIVTRPQADLKVSFFVGGRSGTGFSDVNGGISQRFTVVGSHGASCALGLEQVEGQARETGGKQKSKVFHTPGKFSQRKTAHRCYPNFLDETPIFGRLSHVHNQSPRKKWRPVRQRLSSCWNTGQRTSESDTLREKEYLVTVIDQNGCSVVEKVVLTGVYQEPVVERLRLFPNPGSGRFTSDIRFCRPLDLRMELLAEWGRRALVGRSLIGSSSVLV